VLLTNVEETVGDQLTVPVYPVPEIVVIGVAPVAGAATPEMAVAVIVVRASFVTD
jgi:hypothetical protein